MAKINSTIKMTDQASGTINKINNGFTKMQSKIVALNQGIELAGRLWQAAKAGMAFSDSLTTTAARLNMINDGLQTQGQLQRGIYDAANRSRSSYEDMAANVSKLGMLAGDAFSSTGEIIAFNEALNKAFTVSGAGPQEVSSAMYQLTQAMSSGALQGDELRTIREAAPMLYDAIAKYMGKSKGELKELGAEGKITSDIIKNAMFAASEDINKKFDDMPITFAQVGTSIKNDWALSMQEVSDKLNKALNSKGVRKVISAIQKSIKVFAKVISGFVSVVSVAFEWIGNNLPFVLTTLGLIAGYMLYTMIPTITALTASLWKNAAAWLATNWPILAMIGILGIVYLITGNLKVAIELLTAAVIAWKVAQWLLNGAMYACPIVWIIVLIIAVIAIIFLLIDTICTLTDSTNSAIGIIMGSLYAAGAAVYNIFASLVNFIIDLFSILWDVVAAFVNFFANVFNDPIGSIARLFFDLVDTILSLLQSLASVIDTIFGSNLSKSVKGWRDGLGGWVDKTFGEENEVMSKLDKDQYHMDRWAYGDAWDLGLKTGNDIAAKIDEFDPAALLNDIMSGSEDMMEQYTPDLSALDGSNGVPVEVTNDEINISDEDLKMLKDIASREYMLNYKHITPNVNIEFGDVKETADVNQVKNALEKMMREELTELYVVEEA